jgi:rhodanese-related sulfurtransferase
MAQITTTQSHVNDGFKTTPPEAARFFEARLAHTTDAWDVNEDLKNGVPITVIDARKRTAYEQGHIPGAISVWHREIGNGAEGAIPIDRTIVVYCDGYHCDASTKAAFKLSQLGFRVKELRDGLRGWQEEGYPLVVGASPGPTQVQAKA